jgi:integrase
MHEQIKVHVVDYGRSNLYMRYTDPLTGKHVTRSTGTRKRKDADKAAGKWESELREGRYKPTSKVTWDEFRERYETEGVSGLADTTARKVTSALNMVEEYLQPRRLVDVTADQLSLLQVRLRDGLRTEATIASHLRHIKAALRWAKDVGLLHDVPKIRMPQRAKASKMKGRPITGEEFDRMIAAVPKVILDHQRQDVPEEQWRDHERERVASWQRLLRGLWWSGLRLGEALELRWNSERHLSLELGGKHPLLRIPAESEKGHQDRLLPLAPEAAMMLLTTPEEDRIGRVFDPVPRKRREQRITPEAVGRVLSDIGKKAAVSVNGKWASAHDLRRSFGLRWANRLRSPTQLKELMRHASIDTTLRYYVGANAEATAEALWAASGNTLSNTPDSVPADTAEIPEK